MFPSDLKRASSTGPVAPSKSIKATNQDGRPSPGVSGAGGTRGLGIGQDMAFERTTVLLTAQPNALPIFLGLVRGGGHRNCLVAKGQLALRHPSASFQGMDEYAEADEVLQDGAVEALGHAGPSGAVVIIAVENHAAGR